MRLIDYYYFVTSKFLVNKLGRSEEDAKRSTLMFTTLYLTFLIDLIIYAVGLFKKFDFIELYSSLDFLGFVIVSVVVFLPLYIRYYRSNVLDNVKCIYDDMSDLNKKMMDIFIIIFMIVVPVLWFCIGRLYSYGHI